jgi:catechol 2,3-dioxygenase-like lactoylglutathione lyase family enzyme
VSTNHYIYTGSQFKFIQEVAHILELGIIIKMKYILIFFFVSITINLFGQGAIRPYRLGVTVQNADSSSKWYEEKMGFETYKKMSFPEYDSLRIYFLKKDSFEIELIEKRTSFSIKTFVPGYDLNKAPLRGLSKIVFKVDHINQFYQRIRQKGAKEVLSVTHDEVFNVDFFIIEDLDGNFLQFIEPKKN